MAENDVNDGLAEIILDVCTPEGKTWLARVAGFGGPFGVEREFVRAASSNVSRSGKTGSKTYLVPDGVYESNEGRKRYGRNFYVVADGEATVVTQAEARKALAS